MNSVPSDRQFSASNPDDNRVNLYKRADFKYCRSCYNHPAGKVGVALTDAMIQHGYLQVKDHGFEITSKGHTFFNNLGIDIDSLKTTQRPLARICTDWSEKMPHLAGSLGDAFLSQLLKRQYLTRTTVRRVLRVTDAGRDWAKKTLHIDL